MAASAITWYNTIKASNCKNLTPKFHREYNSMGKSQIPEPNKPTPKRPSSSEPPSIPTAGGGFPGERHHPNPPEPVNPDAATLREQWRFAIRQYSKWYSHAWGTAILAGVSFFALGWVIKGGNPLPSFKPDGASGDKSSSSGGGGGGEDKAAAEVQQPR